MQITAENYQEEAMKFAQYHNDIRYPFGLIASEAGEVLGKVIKLIRDKDSLCDENGEPTEEAKKAIALEVGDCFWAVAAILREKGLDFYKKFGMDFKVERLIIGENTISKLYEAAAGLTYMASCLNGIVRSSASYMDAEAKERSVNLYSVDILNMLAAISLFIGYAPEQILQMNIDKLTDRNNRGVISGSGDYR